MQPTCLDNFQMGCELVEDIDEGMGEDAFPPFSSSFYSLISLGSQQDTLSKIVVNW